MLATALPVGLLIGLSLGALGGGGSILTVPALVYVLQLNRHYVTPRPPGPCVPSDPLDANCRHGPRSARPAQTDRVSRAGRGSGGRPGCCTCRCT